MFIVESSPQTVLDEYSLCHLGCVLPALRSPDRSHDQQSKEERDNESDAETLHHDIILVWGNHSDLPLHRSLSSSCGLQACYVQTCELYP